jgi:hypothetical protein
VATTGLRSGRQLRGVPHVNPLASPDDERLLREEIAANMRIDEARFPRLAARAAEVILADEVQQPSTLDRALALERHFLSPTQYHYSLSLDFVRQRELDPIEDFVANHHTGHCEYFASALVMMLRSQGIPARMVIGYKGGDFNTFGGYYQVRQKHAHAWVEALVPSRDVPEWDMAGAKSASGVWYRLDPTPSSSIATGAIAEDGPLDRVGEVFDYVELLWRDYVLSLNSAKQKDSIYEPVSNRTLASLPTWLESGSVRRMARRLAARLGMDLDVNISRESSTAVIDWRIGVLVVGLVIVPIVLVQGLVLLLRLVRRWRPSAASNMARRRQRPPGFYLRLQSLLGRLHLRRTAGQTARELAGAAMRKLQMPPTRAASKLPGEIVEAYYRVRFGGAALDSQEQAAIEHALAELTPAVNQARQ